MRNREARIQAEIVAWVRTVAPDLLTYAIPNGGLVSKREAAFRKWTGVLAGMPDVGIVGTDGQAFFLEVKAPGGGLSAEQREVFARLRAIGGHAAVVRSVDDVRQAFRLWSIAFHEQQNEEQAA